jgi:hypothetical protein
VFALDGVRCWGKEGARGLASEDSVSATGGGRVRARGLSDGRRREEKENDALSVLDEVRWIRLAVL